MVRYDFLLSLKTKAEDSINRSNKSVKEYVRALEIEVQTLARELKERTEELSSDTEGDKIIIAPDQINENIPSITLPFDTNIRWTFDNDYIDVMRSNRYDRRIENCLIVRGKRRIAFYPQSSNTADIRPVP